MSKGKWRYGVYPGAISPPEPTHFETVTINGERLLKVTYLDGSGRVEYYRQDEKGLHKVKVEGVP